MIFGGPFGPESSHFLPWLWHMLFDGTRLCQCWHSRWSKDLRDGTHARRQHECGNCRLCLYPVDVLLQTGEITCGPAPRSSIRLRGLFSRLSIQR